MQTISMIVQAAATVVLVIVTIIYVVKTGIIAQQMKNQSTISRNTIREQHRLRIQKIRILRVLIEVSPANTSPSAELARLTGIDPDEIEGALIAMIAEGLIELDSSGNYILKTKD